MAKGRQKQPARSEKQLRSQLARLQHDLDSCRNALAAESRERYRLAQELEDTKLSLNAEARLSGKLMNRLAISLKDQV